MTRPPVLWIPGPTEVRPEVLSAMAQPMLSHRNADYAALQADVVAKLKRLMLTQGEVFLSTSSATGLMEGAVRNGVRERSLHLVCGAFSDRWYKIAVACGVDARKLQLPMGEGFTPDLLQAALEQHRPDAVFITHNETSTGVLNPLKALAQVVREHSEALVLVDTVSSLGGVEIRVDEWGLDVCLASIQKCLACPPGFAVAAVSDRALRKAEALPARGLYFDWLTMKKYADKHNTFMTPSIPHIYALDYQLAQILEHEGLENRWQRHRQLAEQTSLWARSMGIEYLAEPAFRSPTVSSLNNTLGWDVAALIKAVQAEHGLLFGNGYGELKGKNFRIGHMGDHTAEGLAALLQAIEDTASTINQGES